MTAPGKGTSGGQLHIVVTCSNRKTQAVPPQLRLGAVPGSTPASRRRRWTARLSAPHWPTRPALQTYAGEHWSVAASLPGQYASRGGARLWVCSAGYGLISADAPIAAYSATFAAGHADSVPWSSASPREWWRELSTWEGPQPGTSRTLATLVRADPAATFLLVLSPPYLRACRDDILDAASAVDNADHLIIISVGADRSGPLADLLLPADSRLQGAFGGSKLSLNVRIASHVISSGVLGRAAASAALADVARTQPAPIVHDRQRLTDTEARAWIRRNLAADPHASATRLLRLLRDSGLACEQHRFYQMYRDLAGDPYVHAS